MIRLSFFIQRCFFLKALCLFICLIFLSISSPLHAAKKEKKIKETTSLDLMSTKTENGYTVNFTNISAIELIKFLSKIASVNFIYNENELAFSVTLVSEEPTSSIDLMTAFIQILRVNGFSILEEGKNLIITKAPEMGYLATIVSTEHPLENGKPPPIVTRVFPIKNANPLSLAPVIKSMLSIGALLEVSPETRHLILTDSISNVDKVAELLQTLDAPMTALQVDAYNSKNISVVNLVTLANQIIIPLAEGNPVILVPQIETNTVFIVSTPFLIEKAISILEDLDSVPTAGKGKEKILSSDNIFLYKVTNKTPEEIQASLKQISQDLKEMGFASQGLLETIENIHYIKATGVLLFVGDATSMAKIKELLSEIDVPTKAEDKETFLIYKIKIATEEQIEHSLRQFLDNLNKAEEPDIPLIQAIKSMKWIKETDSLVFTGQSGALHRLGEVLADFDVPPETSKTGLTQIPAFTDFFMYTPKNRTGESLLKAIHNTAKSLQDAGLANPAIIETLKTAKWLPSSGAIIFTGDKQSLDAVKDLIKTVDAPIGEELTIFIYRVKHVPKETVQKGLDNFADSIPDDELLRDTIDSMKWIPESNSFVFRGPPSTIKQIQEVLNILDTETQAQVVKAEQKTYFIYKLSNVEGDVILKDLDRVARNIETTGIDNQSLVEAIKSIEWVKATNSLLITGTPQAIDQLKAIIADFDVEREKGIELEAASNFFIYKPKYRAPEDIRSTLVTFADDLKQAGLSDPSLIQSITSMRYVEATETLVFAGSASTITKIKELLNSIDTPTEEQVMIQQVGKTTFIIYKIRYVPAIQLLASLRSVARDLEHAEPPDRSLIRTLDSMRYVKETNSIIFIGSKETLDRVEQLLQKFDIPGLAAEEAVPVARTGVETFFLYTPKYQSGEELIQTLKEFEQNLYESGVQNPALFDTINHLKWMEKTSSIVISGDQTSVDKVKELLERFDIPGPERQREPTIETIEDVSFLIYKLQYHKGVEIESALQKIATEFKHRQKESGLEKSQKIVEAINSVQWIEVTNSLIATGEPQTLSKLKELIQNIDVPLRQVFIEILVVETSLVNTLNFGLRWGSQGKYLNKFSYATANLPTPPPQGTDPLVSFQNNLAAITATNPPTGQDIPFAQGAWDLGVIGNLIFHKGKSYFALGSLIDALQNDTDSTVVLNQKAITQDGKTTSVFFGSNLPFSGSVVTNTGQNTTVTNQNLEYRDVGVNLTITPTLGDNDIITIELNQEITEMISNPVQPTGGGSESITVFGIATSKTSTTTRLHVPDQHFVAISGQIRNDKTHTRNGIPCLGGLPLIGLAFSQNNIIADKTNVIVFLKPHIVDDPKIYKAITDRQENILRDQAPDKEFYDQGLDLIKTAENE